MLEIELEIAEQAIRDEEEIQQAKSKVRAVSDELASKAVENVDEISQEEEVEINPAEKWGKAPMDSQSSDEESEDNSDLAENGGSGSDEQNNNEMKVEVQDKESNYGTMSNFTKTTNDTNAKY